MTASTPSKRSAEASFSRSFSDVTPSKLRGASLREVEGSPTKGQDSEVTLTVGEEMIDDSLAASEYDSDREIVVYKNKGKGKSSISPQSCPDSDFIRHDPKAKFDVFGSPTQSASDSFGDAKSVSLMSDASSKVNSANSSSKENSAVSSTDWRAKSSPLQAHGSTSQNWRSNGREEALTPSRVKSSPTTEPYKTPESNGPVSAENAQAHFPPSSCVFVANLTQAASEDSLEVEVTKAFMEFGACWVKIRRDKRNMPYAFAQYMTNEEAQKAVVLGKNKVILGRPCRTEMADAPRTFYISRKDGLPVSEKEVAALVEPFGQVSSIWPADPTTKAVQRLAEGLFVEFVFYDSGRSALMNLRDSNLYRFEQFAKGSPGKSPASRMNEQSENRAFLDRYEQDKRSLFVGNLPRFTTAAQLRELFGHFGKIVDVTVIARPSSIRGIDWHTFAFVEFDSPKSVRGAVQDRNGYNFNSHTLKVNQKNSEIHNKQVGGSIARHHKNFMMTPRTDRRASSSAYEQSPSRQASYQRIPESPLGWSPMMYTYQPVVQGVGPITQSYMPSGFFTGSPTYQPHVPRTMEHLGPAPTMAPYFPTSYGPEPFGNMVAFPPPPPQFILQSQNGVAIPLGEPTPNPLRSEKELEKSKATAAH